MMTIERAAPAARGEGTAIDTPAIDTPAIEAEEVWFSYARRTPVLRGVSLGLHAGQVTMLLGRSGSGKTTLLRVLKGLLRPERGQVRWQFAAHGKRAAGAAAVAYIPQSLGLVHSLSALDNVLSGALARTSALRSLAHNFPARHVDEARSTLAELGIGDKAYEPTFRLSGGERQRVAIARALLQRPRFILADEFVSQLDAVTAEDILAMTRRIAETGVGMLITTHETDVVEQHADRVLAMREGVIVQDTLAGSMNAERILRLLR